MYRKEKEGEKRIKNKINYNTVKYTTNLTIAKLTIYFRDHFPDDAGLNGNL